MRRILIYAASCTAMFTVAYIIFWAFDGFGLHGQIAAILGVVVSSLLGIALMGLIFWSDQSDRDAAVYTLTASAEPPADEPDTKSASTPKRTS